jgi:hypothetical protein
VSFISGCMDPWTSRLLQQTFESNTLFLARSPRIIIFGLFNPWSRDHYFVSKMSRTKYQVIQCHIPGEWISHGYLTCRAFATWFFNICVSFIGSTPLHLAVMARNETVFSLLLNCTSQPVDLNIRTLEGHTALWFALLTSLEYEEGSFATRLLKKGASPSPVSVDFSCW